MQGRPSFFLGGGGIYVESYRRAVLLKNVQQKYEKNNPRFLKFSLNTQKIFADLFCKLLRFATIIICQICYERNIEIYMYSFSKQNYSINWKILNIIDI